MWTRSTTERVEFRSVNKPPNLTRSNSSEEEARVVDFERKPGQLETMAKPEILSSIGLFQAPVLTVGHRCMGVAALLGACFVVLHLITVVITCTVEGFNWGVNAWVLDSMGFLAGLFFTIQCGLSSSRKSADFRTGNTWICVWALATLGARILDTLMLFGVVKWSAVYITPEGSVLWSNIVSEIVVGMAFTIAALVGAMILLICPQDVNPAQTEGSRSSRI